MKLLKFLSLVALMVVVQVLSLPVVRSLTLPLQAFAPGVGTAWSSNEKQMGDQRQRQRPLHI